VATVVKGRTDCAFLVARDCNIPRTAFTHSATRFGTRGKQLLLATQRTSEFLKASRICDVGWEPGKVELAALRVLGGVADELCQLIQILQGRELGNGADARMVTQFASNVVKVDQLSRRIGRLATLKGELANPEAGVASWTVDFVWRECPVALELVKEMAKLGYPGAKDAFSAHWKGDETDRAIDQYIAAWPQLVPVLQHLACRFNHAGEHFSKHMEHSKQLLLLRFKLNPNTNYFDWPEDHDPEPESRMWASVVAKLRPLAENVLHVVGHASPESMMVEEMVYAALWVIRQRPWNRTPTPAPLDFWADLHEQAATGILVGAFAATARDVAAWAELMVIVMLYPVHSVEVERLFSLLTQLIEEKKGGSARLLWPTVRARLFLSYGSVVDDFVKSGLAIARKRKKTFVDPFGAFDPVQGGGALGAEG
jgi:hypothetical protein